MNKNMLPSRSRFIPRLMGGFFVVWVITAILSVAVSVAGLYVAYHFIMKYW